MIIGICGLSGSGKSAVGDVFVQHHEATVMLFADEMKRICKKLFQFTEEQLWGPSEERNKPDKRYPREHTWSYGRENPQGSSQVTVECLCCGWKTRDKFINQVKDKTRDAPQCYLTPRYALQTLGTEWGRGCYPPVWAESTIRDAQGLLRSAYIYHRAHGLIPTSDEYLRQKLRVGPEVTIKSPAMVVIADVRFKNEVAALKKAGGKVVRVMRPGFDKPKWDHPSETEQLEIPDEEFDHIIENNQKLADLPILVKRAMSYLTGRIIPYDEGQADVPPFMRR